MSVPMRLAWTTLRAEPFWMTTPTALPEMTLPVPMPPTVLPDVRDRVTPAWLPWAPVPPGPVPMKLDCTRFPEPPTRLTPLPTFSEITLPTAVVAPPMVLPDASSTVTPVPFCTTLPAVSRPMRLLCTRLLVAVAPRMRTPLPPFPPQ